MRKSTTRKDAVEAVLDLRDNAYDLPEAWDRFTVARFMQFLMEQLDDAGDKDTNWAYFGPLVAEALAKARSDDPSQF